MDFQKNELFLHNDIILSFINEIKGRKTKKKTIIIVSNCLTFIIILQDISEFQLKYSKKIRKMFVQRL